MSVLAVTGLKREARIVEGAGVVTLASGGHAASLAGRIEALLSSEVMGVISIGIAGALDETLKVGDAIIATHVVANDAIYRVDENWSGRLWAQLPEARRGPVAGSDAIAVDAAAKSALGQATGALCIDMESHVAAMASARRGLPFVALRFISDASDRALPKAVQVGMKPDGGMDVAAVLSSLAADPRQLPALIRTAAEAQAAFQALLRGRGRLGPALGFPDV